MAAEADWGPWVGVPKSKQTLCAVSGCEHRGIPQVCLYDGRRHHHGCIHYDCDAAKMTRHGLMFREGWGLLCPSHYAVLLNAQTRYKQTSPARSLAELEG